VINDRRSGADELPRSKDNSSRGDVERIFANEFEDWQHRPRLATAVLSQLAKERRGRMAWEVLRAMLQHQVETNIYHYGAAIGACEKSADWTLAIDLLDVMTLQRVVPNVYAFSSAISACGSHWTRALCLLESMMSSEVLPNVVTCNSAITACAKGNAWTESLGLLWQLNEVTLMPDVVSFNSVIKASEEGAYWQLPLELMQRMKQDEVHPDAGTYNSAMNSMLQGGSWPRALLLMEAMPAMLVAADVITMNTAMVAFLTGGHWAWALELLETMPLRRVAPSTISYNIAISACEHAANGGLALDMLGRLSSTKLRPTTVSVNSAISALQKGSQWQLALGTLWSMPKRKLRADGVSFNAAMAACVTVGQWRLCLHLLQRMLDLELRTDQVSYSTAMSACREVGKWAIVLDLHAMETARLPPDTVACNVAIAAVAREGKWIRAKSLLTTLEDSGVRMDVASFNAIASGCASWKACLVLMEEMRRRNILPNEITFTTVLSCQERAGSWEGALATVAAMRKQGISCADAEDLAIMALAEADQLQLALALCRRPTQGPGTTALLMACEQHGHDQEERRVLSGLADALPEEVAVLLRKTSAGLLSSAQLNIPTVAITRASSSYRKELSLLRRALHVEPNSPDAVLEAMGDFGQELGEAGAWAKFAGGSKAQSLLAALRGAAPSRTAGPPEVLEIGTYCSYSAISIVTASSAQVTSIEIDPVLVAIARGIIAHAGLSTRVRVWTGHSRLLLPLLMKRRWQERPTAPWFDAMFIDRWGTQYPEDLDFVEKLRLLRPSGALLVADNVLRTAAAHFLWRLSTDEAQHRCNVQVRILHGSAGTATLRQAAANFCIANGRGQ